MKRITLLLVGTLLSMSSFAQLQVSTTAENRRALLEEFTGINCVFCPAGHVIASNLKNTHSSNFYVMNVHVGSFANPNSGQPDFRTSFGTSLTGQAGVTGYPAGTVNRRVFSGLGQTAGGTAMGRGNWTNATTQIRQVSAYVNIAVEAEVDEQTRQLRVITQYYYTDDSGLPTNKLNVALLQNGVEGPQTGGSNYNASNIMPNGKYVHNHTLRHFLTGQWGVDITNTTQGSTATDTFYYTIPASLSGIPYDLSNLEVVAFIAEGQQEIINVGGAGVSVTNHANSLDAVLMELPTINDQCPGVVNQTMWVKVKNMGANTITALDFDITANGNSVSTYNWTGSMPYGQVLYINIPSFTFTANTSTNLVVNIDAVNAVVDDVTTNNSATRSFGTATTVNTTDITIKITLDRYGDETSWTLKNSAGVNVGVSPTYTSATANGAYPQPDINLTLPNDCYTFEILDSYGDGMCCAYGNGKYEIWADGVLIPGMSGANFTSSDIKKLTIDAIITTVEEVEELNTVRIFPNPAHSEFVLEFGQQVENGLINIIDLQGRIVRSENVAGVDFHKITVSNLPNGLYMVEIQADGQRIIEKLSVLK